jgi:peptidoglycan/LPS O-acetylase OafA/YrhL
LGNDGIKAGSGRFIAGDPLRALAALAVVLVHVMGVSLVVPSARAAFLLNFPSQYEVQFGAAGKIALFAGGEALLVFFVLSGYLIGRPFVNAFIDRRAPPARARYARARVFRVVPVFWVAIVATLITFGSLGARPGQILAVFAFAGPYTNTAFFDHIQQAWSLTGEVVFYVALPLGFFALTPLRRLLNEPAGRMLGLGIALLGLFIALLVLAAYDPFPTGPHLRPAQVGFYFVPGVGLALLERWLAPRLRGRQFGSPLGLGLIALGLAGGFAVYPSPPGGRLGIAVPALSATLVVGGCLVNQWATGGCWRVLDTPVLQALGRRAYCIYMVHYGVMVFLEEHMASPQHAWRRLALLGATTLAATLVLVEPLHRWVEEPFMALGRRRRGRSADPSATAPAGELAPAGPGGSVLEVAPVGPTASEA